jgi:hypothetical protein
MFHNLLVFVKENFPISITFNVFSNDSFIHLPHDQYSRDLINFCYCVLCL